MYQTQLFPTTISEPANDQLIAQLRNVIDPALSVDDNFNQVRFHAGKSGRTDLLISIKLHHQEAGKPERNLHRITVLADEVPIIAFTQITVTA